MKKAAAAKYIASGQAAIDAALELQALADGEAASLAEVARKAKLLALRADRLEYHEEYGSCIDKGALLQMEFELFAYEEW